MPSTDNATFTTIVGWFGDPDPGPVEDLLTAKGYTITRQWMIVRPTPSHTMNEVEETLVRFLVQEWDYGFAG